MATEIKFYSHYNKYYEFSNFQPATFDIDVNGKQESFRTTEHYYQAMKFYVPFSNEHMNIFRLIQTAKTPKEAFNLGKFMKGKFDWIDKVIADYSNIKIRPDWDAVKDDVMRKGIYAKFTQNPKLKDLLKSTGNATLIENSPVDYYWGCGKNGTGKNMLGKLLMELRDII